MAIDYTEYKALSFDVYGTLINWETGIFNELVSRFDEQKLESALGATSADDLRTQLLSLFHRSELSIQKDFPSLSYNVVLKEVMLALGERLELNVDEEKAISFSQSVPHWPVFKDTVAALKKLQKHYKLVVLSNISSSAFDATLKEQLYGIHFDAVYTAEEIGSYKPDLDNFEYLIKHIGIDFKIAKNEILHVANSITHDHVPAKKVGMRPGVWIERRGARAIMSGGVNVEDKIAKGKVELGGRFKTLGDFAQAVEEAFAAKKGT